MDAAPSVISIIEVPCVLIRVLVFWAKGYQPVRMLLKGKHFFSIDRDSASNPFYRESCVACQFPMYLHCYVMIHNEYKKVDWIGKLKVETFKKINAVKKNKTIKHFII